FLITSSDPPSLKCSSSRNNDSMLYCSSARSSSTTSASAFRYCSDGKALPEAPQSSYSLAKCFNGCQKPSSSMVDKIRTSDLLMPSSTKSSATASLKRRLCSAIRRL